jgi:hypothetical protein
MEEKTKNHLQEIQVQLTRLNGFIKVIIFCMSVVTITLVAEVSRHW